MTEIRAPFTDNQVENLKEWQSSPWVHPFTCPNSNAHGEVKLTPYKHGWLCAGCDYTQQWAHSFMTSGSMLEALEDSAYHNHMHAEVCRDDCPQFGVDQDIDSHEGQADAPN